jgi:hypothetical protein
LILSAALAAMAAAPPRSVSAIAVTRQLVAARVVALAWLDDTRLILLTADELLLYRSAEPGSGVVARLTLPGPRRMARAAAGMLLVDPDASAAWAMTNRCTRAALVEWGGERLALRSEADALPWPGSATGLRYREGMDWIDGEVPSLGSGPFLAVAARGEGLAVAPDARVLLAATGKQAGDSDAPPALRIGPALAALWPGWIAASSARPPGDGDALIVLIRDPAGLRAENVLEIQEPIRALASRALGAAVRLAAATDDAEGRTRLVFVDLRRSER